MRIALVHPYPWPEVRRGAERYVEDLSTYLAGHGHEVTVLTGTHEDPGRRRSASGVLVVRRRHARPVHRLNLSEVETFGLVALGELAARRFDVVHAMVPAAALAGRLARLPTLYTVLGHPSPDQVPADRLPRLLFFAAVRHASEVATLSAASAEELKTLAGREALVLSPGVRAESFPAALEPRTGPPTVLLSASLTDPRKRAALAVSAFSLLLRRRPEARLVLSGQGEPAPLLASLAPHVRAAVVAAGPGSPEEVPDRYRSATVTLLPASHEAFGLVLVESLASGTPVVCTPDGGMPELVGSDVGVVAEAATEESLCAALDAGIALAAEPGTPRRCAEGARRWDWEAVVGPAHVAAYRALASRHRSSPAPS